MPERRLAGRAPVPRDITHMGAIEGRLRYLGLALEPHWAYGASGYAFLMNLDPDVPVSGPAHWRSGSVLGSYATWKLPGAWSGPGAGWPVPTPTRPSRAPVEGAIDRGRPRFGGGSGPPEFFTVHGYGDGGILYRTRWFPEREQ